jgi:hypothetical protein
VEKIIGIIFFGSFAFFSWGIVILVLWAFANLALWLDSPDFSDWEPENNDKHRRNQKVFLILKVVFIVVMGLATISAHLNTEIGESIYSPSAILHGSGPARNLSLESAGESWSDCFVINVPNGRLGFLDIWWSMAKSWPEYILGPF